jgi:beta-galactosidase
MTIKKASLSYVLLRILFCFLMCNLFVLNGFAQDSKAAIRETISMNSDWRFALGNASDVSLDFNFMTSHFSYLAKTGYGDGAASEKFDDRAWRTVQLPHDWCVALPFDIKGSNSHGSKAIGKYFPENSIGWYRKTFTVAKSDTSKRIRIEFEGVYRNSKVFVNGFYVGREESGYIGFGYDITEYLNFGGTNVIAVRVDATAEEGWFYEGAGIYRNVWLVKANPVHVARLGTFVSSTVDKNMAKLLVRTTLQNEKNAKTSCEIENVIYTKDNKIVAQGSQKNLVLQAGEQKQFFVNYSVTNPSLWSVETPSMYTLKTTVRENGVVVDSYETPFGIRTVAFDKDKGFFLNGKSLKVKGVCMHQDHAGIGVAIPYELQKWRIQQLKSFGVNAIRTSHNPPSPELLDICDELGMLVMDEVRLMGINDYHQNQVEQQITRDRNHPSVFIWSLGNEEWQIEGNEKGAKIVENMQNFAHRLDSSRTYTVAISGGWDTGIGMKSDVMGYNYLSHGNVDEHHKKFPNQPSIGTEESNTVRTRGIFETNEANCWLAPQNLYDGGMEGGWKYYDERPYLSGLFYWTGFDYRGEPTPYWWPAVVSQFGIFDLCGFPKDNAYYLKSWWSQEPTVHIENHWNWTSGKKLTLTINSNCKTVELLLNGKSLGKKSVEKNGHITWPVTFELGTLTALGYGQWGNTSIDSTKVIAKQELKTTGKAVAIKVVSQKTALTADGNDIAIMTVQAVDASGNIVPDANIPVTFDVQGDGKIIGVGNGNPSSHETEVFEDKIVTKEVKTIKELVVNDLKNRPEIALGFDDSKWRTVYSAEPSDWQEYKDSLFVIRGEFMLDDVTAEMKISLFAKSILENQSLYINGTLIRANIQKDDKNQAFVLDHSILKKGKNEYVVVGQKIRRPNPWETPNRDPGLIQIVTPVTNWKRETFNGLSQILIKSTNKAGTIKLKASAEGLQAGEIIIETK